MRVVQRERILRVFPAHNSFALTEQARGIIFRRDTSRRTATSTDLSRQAASGRSLGHRDGGGRTVRTLVWTRSRESGIGRIGKSKLGLVELSTRDFSGE